MDVIIPSLKLFLPFELSKKTIGNNVHAEAATDLLRLFDKFPGSVWWSQGRVCGTEAREELGLEAVDGNAKDGHDAIH